MLDDELLELVEVAGQGGRDPGRHRPLGVLQLDEQPGQLVADGPLAELRPAARRRPALELVEQLVHLVDLPLQAPQLRVARVALLQQLLGVLVERLADGVPLLLAHGHELGQIPALDHFDRGEDHVLAHAHLLLEPQVLAALVVALEPLDGLRGLGIRRRDHDAHARHLALDAGRRDHLPFRLVRVAHELHHLVLRYVRLQRRKKSA